MYKITWAWRKFINREPGFRSFASFFYYFIYFLMFLDSKINIEHGIKIKISDITALYLIFIFIDFVHFSRLLFSVVICNVVRPRSLHAS